VPLENVHGAVEVAVLQSHKGEVEVRSWDRPPAVPALPGPWPASRVGR
jgi:hypothetical protein